MERSPFRRGASVFTGLNKKRSKIKGFSVPQALSQKVGSESKASQMRLQMSRHKRVELIRF